MKKVLLISMGGTAEKGWSTESDMNCYSKESRVFKYLEEVLGIKEMRMITLSQCESTEITQEVRRNLYDTILEEGDFTSIVIIHGENSMSETAKYLHDHAAIGIHDKTIVGVSSNTPIGFEGNDVLLLLGYAVACSQLLEPGKIYFCKKPFTYEEIG
jgi:L-asparaginase